MSDERFLSTDKLLSNGFIEIKNWQVSNERLLPLVDVPLEHGVYAFAVNDHVLYVGLASQSLRKRLAHYVKPGPTQSTNIRLNKNIIEHVATGDVVRIFVAHPPDTNWNGFRISGAEGLEAALIRDFDLLWNQRGVRASKSLRERAKMSKREGGRPAVTRLGDDLTIRDAILKFVGMNPHSTEMQIAKGVIGVHAIQQQVNPYCRELTEAGLIRRIATRPFTYQLQVKIIG